MVDDAGHPHSLGESSKHRQGAQRFVDATGKGPRLLQLIPGCSASRSQRDEAADEVRPESGEGHALLFEYVLGVLERCLPAALGEAQTRPDRRLPVMANGDVALLGEREALLEYMLGSTQSPVLDVKADELRVPG